MMEDLQRMQARVMAFCETHRKNLVEKRKQAPKAELKGIDEALAEVNKTLKVLNMYKNQDWK